MTSSIRDFRGPYRWLSNFHAVEVEFEGKTYASTEHAYQAAKTLNEDDRERIRTTVLAKDAKKIGNVIELRPDWDDVKYGVMLELTRKKYLHADLRAKLLATGDAELVEGNYWHDRYWGVCTCATHNGEGKNHLGQILMQVRGEIRRLLG